MSDLFVGYLLSRPLPDHIPTADASAAQSAISAAKSAFGIVHRLFTVDYSGQLRSTTGRAALPRGLRHPYSAARVAHCVRRNR